MPGAVNVYVDMWIKAHDGLKSARAGTKRFVVAGNGKHERVILTRRRGVAEFGW